MSRVGPEMPQSGNAMNTLREIYLLKISLAQNECPTYANNFSKLTSMEVKIWRRINNEYD